MPDVDKDDMKASLEIAIRRHGLETDVRNIIYHMIRSTVKTEVKNLVQAVSNLILIRYINTNCSRT